MWLSESEVAQSCPTLCNPVDCSLPRLLHPWDSPGKNTGVGCHPDPGIEPGSPTLEADALTSEPPGKQEAVMTAKQDGLQLVTAGQGPSGAFCGPDKGQRPGFTTSVAELLA